jgi:hypothetical protein
MLMSWLMRVLAAVGIALAFVIVIVFVIGRLGTSDDTTQALALAIGNRMVNVAGHFKDMTQESIADGIKIVVDSHEVVVSSDQLSVDGKTEILEPDRDVMIYVGKDGRLQVKTIQESEGASEEAPN